MGMFLKDMKVCEIYIIEKYPFVVGCVKLDIPVGKQVSLGYICWYYSVVPCQELGLLFFIQFIYIF